MDAPRVLLPLRLSCQGGVHPFWKCEKFAFSIAELTDALALEVHQVGR